MVKSLIANSLCTCLKDTNEDKVLKDMMKKLSSHTTLPSENTIYVKTSGKRKEIGHACHEEKCLMRLLTTISQGVIITKLKTF